MRAVMVVVVAPCRNQMAGMAQGREQVLVEALIAEPTVEALNQAILHGLARRNVVPFDLAILLPCEHGIRRQFGSVVADHHAGIAPHLGDLLQLAGDADARERGVHDRRQAFPAEAVDHAEDAEPAAISKSI